MQRQAVTKSFYGWRVVGAAFVLAMFGLGIGFFGPAIYLNAVHSATGWSLLLVSTAVTVHFLTGAIVVANLPRLHRRFGVPFVTKAGAIAMALGVLGWAAASAPWQLFAAAALSGGGWVALGIAAINSMVAPWFVQRRPTALAIAYTGANLGGVVFSPLWVMAIDRMGFPAAAATIGVFTVLTVWIIADRFLARSPGQMGLLPDGASAATIAAPLYAVEGPQHMDGPLWHDRRFVTLAAGMTIGLFAQIGLTAHLVSLLAPTLGSQAAGSVMALVTAMAILGRLATGWIITAGIDRRLVAAASYAVQIVGSLMFTLAAGTSTPLVVAGALLFGLGFGNGTFLPPLIAQAEFAADQVARVVALAVAWAQAGYAFAPITFGLIRQLAVAPSEPAGGAAAAVFAAAALLQVLALSLFLVGRTRQRDSGQVTNADAEGGAS